MIAYFDCFSGISGDMTLGACIDLGVSVEWLKDTLGRLPLTGFDITAGSIFRSGIQAKKVRVNVAHGGKTRHYGDIVSLIHHSPYSDFVKEMSIDIFDKIAEAESKIHHCDKASVHFHEVGGVDAIVDIVGAALCIEHLAIDKIIASKIPLGTGFVDCHHGMLPVPAPATLEILKGVPVYGSGISQELVTPTGAAIISTLAESFGDIPDIHIHRVGYGAGHREIEARPNLLRVVLGLASSDGDDQRDVCLNDTVVVIETSIDDMNPEIFGYVMDRLFEDGALDVYWLPVFMKKNRPGTLAQIICPKSRMDTIMHRVLSETTSIGLRYYEAQRKMLARDHIHVDTPYGKIQMKRVMNMDRSTRMVPEYEVCRRIALDRKIPLRMVYDTIMKAAVDES